MERFNGSEHRTTETYVIQGADSNPHLAATPPLEEITVMDNEMAPEYIVDQGPYYPAAANYYGYYCTGFESPGEWEDHHSFFGLDGPDVHYTGLQTESLPYVYYTPSYGYAQSPYNPYNPYIPGAIVGVDGPFVGAQQYYTGPTYQHPVSSPAYLPVIVQPRPDIPNPSVDPTLVNLAASSASKPDGAGLKHAPPTTSTGLAMHPPRAVSGEARLEPSQSVSHLMRSSVKASEGSQANLAPSKQPASYGTNTSSGVPNSTSSYVTQGRNASGAVQAADPLSFGRVQSLRSQLKVAVPANTDFGSNAQGWNAADKIRPTLQFSSGVLNNGNGGPDILGEQNRGPRTNRIKGPWTPSMSVKAYTTKAGASNAQGNIVIYADQYNRDDFLVNYPNAKFFVIKSYSEDDVHKSIKYNVWSSTPVGNKRLDSAYEDAHRISGGRPGNCPVFLFFSVNASGQFCGVAEMIGPVDFQKDMDFWQQDKWNGSFPVKWHIIKDVPNSNFRHIILENNENKPVTNSRDTQEIRYMQGMEMLNIFKTYSSKTSILDDFMYYEDRQKLMQEEKARQLGKNYDATSFFLPAFVPSTTPSAPVNQSPKVDSRPINQPLKGDKKRTNQLLNADEKPIIEPPKADEKSINQLLKVDGKPINQPPKVDEKPTKDNEMNKLVKMLPKDEQVVSKLSHSSICEKETQHKAVEGVKDVMKIGSLSIDPKDSKEGETNISEPLSETTGCSTGPVDVVTVGSMPVKVNGFSESSSSILTVGSIPIDPKAVKLKK